MVYPPSPNNSPSTPPPQQAPASLKLQAAGTTVETPGYLAEVGSDAYNRLDKMYTSVKKID